MTPQDAQNTFFSPANIAMITRGSWLQQPHAPTSPTSGICTDTRDLLQPNQQSAPSTSTGQPLNHTKQGGATFLTLAGENHDAHTFLPTAAQNGASLLIVDNPDKTDIATINSAAPSVAPGILHVQDTLAALHALAFAYRDILADHNVKLIAVAGSNGKTSTRHLIHALLHGRMISSPTNASNTSPSPQSIGLPDRERPDLWRVHQLLGSQSPKSFNNHIGVPLTILAAPTTDDFLVLEIGTNHPGEVNTLAAIARPDAAVITSIGREHLEFFHNIENVAAEQASLLPHLKPNALIAIEKSAAPLIDAHQDQSPPTQPNHRVTFGFSADASYALTAFQQDFEGMSLDIQFPNQQTLNNIHLPFLGRHTAVNIMAAIAVAKWIGIDDIQLNLGFLALTTPPGRLQRITLQSGITLIHDAYNSNPDSLHAALDLLTSLYPRGSRSQPSAVAGSISPATDSSPATAVQNKPYSKTIAPGRIAILGDMLELGEHETDEHRSASDRIRDMLAANELRSAVFIGPRIAAAVEASFQDQPDSITTRIRIFPNISPAAEPIPQAIHDHLANIIDPGNIVLIKASRSLALERLIPTITKIYPLEAPDDI
ncbi:UDP-N-acetylmuramoyl-tripeptide--D-alanyl-D-alanine ligase [Poriferisphaera sp. WC338]|uniref:UDP-N-acetylmuramoyl-tripeptide--D-alanyl-D- alanine ligase n=1 Tax=Poriferisphaera sp. WC338 TaxID=3425129 RepID=UPI003D815BA5